MTDASLVLGHLDPAFFLGGAMPLDVAAARAAIAARVACPLGLSIEAAADAIIEVATANMVRAINEITVDQGIDPREAVLVGGGGAAGLNSVRIARHLGCATLLIPETGAALSAAGALMSDLKASHRAAIFTRTDRFDAAACDLVLEELVARCDAFAAASGASDSRRVLRAEARYATEVWDIEVEFPIARFGAPGAVAAFTEAFHAAHGHSSP
jgi:N-methylhydantoinase A